MSGERQYGKLGAREALDGEFNTKRMYEDTVFLILNPVGI